MAALAHIPPWGFGANEYKGAHQHGREHGGAQHQPPPQARDVGRIRHIEKDQIRHVAEHDAESSPHLPLHHQGTTDGRRGGLGRVNGHGGRLGANAEAQGKTADEQMPP